MRHTYTLDMLFFLVRSGRVHFQLRTYFYNISIWHLWFGAVVDPNSRSILFYM